MFTGKLIGCRSTANRKDNFLARGLLAVRKIVLKQGAILGKCPITTGICWSRPALVSKVRSWYATGLLWEGFDEGDIDEIDIGLVAVVS